MAFGPTGPFHFQATKEFDGKKEKFDDISFKSKSYLSLMNPAFASTMNNIEASLGSPVTEAHFNDDGNMQASLVHLATQFQWILVSLCTRPASAVLR